MTRKRKADAADPPRLAPPPSAQPNRDENALVPLKARFDEVIVRERELDVYVEVAHAGRRYYTTRSTALEALEHLHTHVFGASFQHALSPAHEEHKE